MLDSLIAAFLGFVEGLTEFLPVSSTGHLIVLVDGLHFAAPPGRVFEVFIQLGAILAVVVLFRKKIWRTVWDLPRERSARAFALNVILGTLPALVAGAIAHDWIKGHLYNPAVIASALIVGGLIILALDGRQAPPRMETVDDIGWRAALLIGCGQAVALIPGVSRSGATIMSALALGVSRPAATEFSFFLAIPVMTAAVLYDLWKNRDALSAAGDWHLMLIGFAMAFLTALAVVKTAVGFISRHGFRPFAFYRLAFGLAVLIIFYL